MQKGKFYQKIKIRNMFYEAYMMFDITFNPNPHCLAIWKAFFVKMKIGPGWLKQNIF
jgi:hypothetical protein